MIDVTTERRDEANTAARLTRLAILVREAEPWVERPVWEVIKHYTRGLSRNDRGTAYALALNFLVDWASVPESRLGGPMQQSEIDAIPPLDRKIDWAGLAIGHVIGMKMTAPGRSAIGARATPQGRD